MQTANPPEQVSELGREENIATRVRAALADRRPVMEIVAAVVDARNSGMGDIAAALLGDIIEAHPDASAAYYELAFLHRLRGEHQAATSLLARSLRLAGEDARTRLFLGHMLHALGTHVEAGRVLDAIRPQGEAQAADVAAMSELGAYLRAWPLGRALALLDAAKARCAHLDATGVAARAVVAQAECRPFALVRAGDGEGSFLDLGSEDELAHRELYARNRAEFAAIWFGADFPIAESGFAEAARALPEALLGCDVLGIPYESWIRHEYAISSPRGIPSLVNVLRWLEREELPPGFALAKQDVHIDLHAGGLLDPILRTARRVSLISCLDDLPPLLASRYGLEEVVLHRIPGEHGSASLIGSERLAGTHFPNVFGHLSRELDRPREGRLVLVAAGVLGKFYAAFIRRHGGIALDIGSLADAWTGRYTRPGYGVSLRL